MFLLSGEIIASYPGHFIPKSSNCNLTQLPGPVHLFQLTYLAIVSFHTHSIPSSFFLFHQHLAHDSTQCVASTCLTSVVGVSRYTPNGVALLLPAVLVICALIVYLTLGQHITIPCCCWHYICERHQLAARSHVRFLELSDLSQCFDSLFACLYISSLSFYSDIISWMLGAARWA